MVMCPKCKEDITYLNFDVTGTCSSQLEAGKRADYDLSCLTEEIVFDNWSCNNCGEVLFDNEEDAQEFLK